MDIFSIIMSLDYLADASLAKYKDQLVKLKNKLVADYNSKTADMNTWLTRIQQELDELNANIPNIASHLKGALLKRKEATLKDVEQHTKARSALDSDYTNKLESLDRKINTRGLANVFDQIGQVANGGKVPATDKLANFVTKDIPNFIENTIGGKFNVQKK